MSGGGVEFGSGVGLILGQGWVGSGSGGDWIWVRRGLNLGQEEG